VKAALNKLILSMWKNKYQRNTNFVKLAHLGEKPKNCIHPAGTLKCVRICWQ